jgi:hypothetical protein
MRLLKRRPEAWEPRAGEPVRAPGEDCLGRDGGADRAQARAAGGRDRSRRLHARSGALYDALGFAAVGDEASGQLVLGRIIGPTSTLDTVRVLDELGVGSPSRVTFMRCLKRAFVVGSKTAKRRPTSPRTSSGRAARPRRVVSQWRFARYRHDNQAINAMITAPRPSPPGSDR